MASSDFIDDIFNATEVNALEDGDYLAVLRQSGGIRLLRKIKKSNAVMVSALLSKTLSLTDAQIKALPVTPIELVAAPGPDKQLVFSLAAMFGNFPVGYTNVTTSPNEAKINIQDDDGDTFSCHVDTQFFLNALTDVKIFIPPYFRTDLVGSSQEPKADSFHTSLNRPFMLTCDNRGNGPFTGGDAANAMIITVFYAIITL